MRLHTRNNFLSANSSFTLVQISQKIKELLDQMEYSNTDMLLTKEHIQYNLGQLIKMASTHTDLEIERRKESNTFSRKFLVDKRGKLKANFS